MPKILIADELSPRALDIFRSRGLEVDVNVGLKKPDLIGPVTAGLRVLHNTFVNACDGDGRPGDNRSTRIADCALQRSG